MTTSHPLRLVSLLGILALPLLGLLVGCTQVQVAPNTLGDFRMGELQVVADRGFAATYDAAKRGMQDYHLFQTRDDRRAKDGELRGRDAADAQVVIKIREVGPNRTNVRIRYGVPGNLALAQQVYQSMQKHL